MRCAQPSRPGLEVDELGQLGYLGALATLAVAVGGVVPAAGRHHHDAVADAVIDVEPEAELQVLDDACLSEPVRRSASTLPAEPREQLEQVVHTLLVAPHLRLLLK
jgi:hypothetical protein